ncbi:MAG TPA: lysylphosphatidylglycerol synthase transmembrane domain-containing protein [Thermomicrobiales bacterium]|nr:lysylphosphatidylglycerol synthase transmembrane domain-containing protein [Thermomicrobiales bacterium]
MEPSISHRSGMLGKIAAIPTPVIFIGSILIAVLVLWRTGDVHNVVDSLRSANPWLLALGAVLYLVGLFLLCVRWHSLVIMIHGSSNFGRAGEAFLTSVVINYAAPVGLAVPTRAALTKRALGLSLTETSAVALWEVGADVIILGLGSTIWLATGGFANSDVSASDISPLVWIGILATIAVGLGAVYMVMRSVRIAPIRRRLREVMLYPGQNRKQAGISLGVTSIYWIIQGVVLAIMLNALGVQPSVLLVLGITSLPILVGMLSPLPGGAGVRETLMGGIAKIHGVAVSPTIFAAVAYRLALFASIPVLYVLFRVWLSFTKPSTDSLEEI